MRTQRLLFIFLALYLVFIGGSAYYTLIFPVRVFHHILLTGLFALWFYRRLRRDGLPHTPLDAPLLAALVMWFVSALAGIHPRMALEHLWFVLLHVAIFYVLVDLFQRGRQRLVFETQFLMGALVVMISGLEVLSWYFGLGFLPGTQIGWVDVIGPGAWLPLEPIRLSLAMNISTLLAGYVAPLVTITGVWAFTTRRADYRRALGLLALALLLVLALTQSRGGLLSLAAAIGALLVMRAAQDPAILRRIPRFAIAAGALALVAGVVFIFSAQRTGGDLGRLDMYRSAVLMGRDYPVTGVGPGLFGRALRDYRTRKIERDHMASAHNAPLNTLAENGLAGIVISGWLALALLRGWRRTWQAQTTDARRLRVEATIAALLGVAVHSMVDVFTITPIVILIALLLAYSLTGYRSGLERIHNQAGPQRDSPLFAKSRQKLWPFGALRRKVENSAHSDDFTNGQPHHRTDRRRWAAALGLILTLGYGLFWIQADRAQSAYHQSLRGGPDALAHAQAARRLDPHLRLYDLQIAYLLGEDAWAHADDADRRRAAIDAYTHAVTLEPTWDVGWVNLAALYEQQGDIDAALDALSRAAEIMPGPALIHRARLAEATNAYPAQAIIDDYAAGILWGLAAESMLPLADFWQETPLRRAAVLAYVDSIRENAPDIAYRILAAVDPARAAALVPASPASFQEWWIAGEHQMRVEDNPAQAVIYFDRAIAARRRAGDLYAARARAHSTIDPAAAHRDLDLALLLGTRLEYPHAIRAAITDDPAERHALRIRALPPRQIRGRFAAVLYGGRPGAFDLLPSMRYPGPGRDALAAWYAIAEDYRAQNRLDDARLVYNAILDYAPYETEARHQLAALAPDG